MNKINIGTNFHLNKLAALRQECHSQNIYKNDLKMPIYVLFLDTVYFASGIKKLGETVIENVWSAQGTF